MARALIKLSSAQKEIVTSPIGAAAQVLASAGSGKTRVLTERIRFILSETKIPALRGDGKGGDPEVGQSQGCRTWGLGEGVARALEMPEFGGSARVFAPRRNEAEMELN